MLSNKLQAAEFLSISSDDTNIVQKLLSRPAYFTCAIGTLQISSEFKVCRSSSCCEYFNWEPNHRFSKGVSSVVKIRFAAEFDNRSA